MMRYLLVVVCLIMIFHITVAQENFAVITPENAHQLERVARLGHGYVGDIWYEDNQTLLTSNAMYPDETWQYDTQNMGAEPIFNAGIVPQSNILSQLEPSYSYDNDGRWIVEHHGIWNIETEEKILTFSDERSTRLWFTTDRYVIVWRTLRNSNQVGCLNDDSVCRHQILIVDKLSETVHAELYQQDIVWIRPVLNDSHLAIVREQTTDFYILSRRAVTFAFWIDTPLSFLNDAGTYAADYDSQSNTLAIWNLQTQSIYMTLNYLEGERVTLSYVSPDERYLVVRTTVEFVEDDVPINAHPMKNIAIWDMQTGTRLSTIEVFAPRAAIRFSDDGRYFGIYTQTEIFYNSSSGTDFFITLYETETGRQIAQIDNNTRYSATGMAFSPDNQQFAISFADGRIVLIDTATGETQAETRGYAGYIHFVHFDDEHIITSSGSSHTDLWDLDTLEHVRRIDNCMFVGVNLAQNTGLCHPITIRLDDNIPPTFVDLQTGDRTAFDVLLTEGWIYDAEFSPNGQEMVVSSDLGVWDIANQALITTLAENDPMNPMREVQYLADGTIIASRSHGILWDADTYEVIAELPVTPDSNSLGIYSEIGDWVAFPAHDTFTGDFNTGELIVWRLSDLLNNFNAEPIARINGYGYGTTSASPDGRLLAIHGSIIEMQTFTVIAEFPMRGYELEFSPDGRYLIAADGIFLYSGYDHSIKIGSAHVWGIPND